MQKITSHLWFDKQAKEAAAFYTELFPGSRIISSTVLEDTPSGNAETVLFELAGQTFQAISAGPYFQFNSAISLMVACESAGEVDRLHGALTQGGSELMELDEYPFSPRYAWIKDRYGLNWQLMQTDAPVAQKIWPSLLFSDKVCGKAQEAAAFYAGIFPGSGLTLASPYEPGQLESDVPKAAYVQLHLGGVTLSAMDNAMVEGDAFNEAFSLMVSCKDQREIDTYWEKLSAVPEAEQCGWLKDRYGVSWQIVPERLNELLSSGSREQMNRVIQAFLQMKKFDIAALERAYRGE